MMLDLFRIFFYLKNFPEVQGVVACRDPTMLFTALMWGENLARKKKLSEAFWPLKTALFQAGDRLIEKVTAAKGLKALKEDYEKGKKEHDFYLFSPELLGDLKDSRDFSDLKQGYGDCRRKLETFFPQEASWVLKEWISATNLALESVFVLEDWSCSFETRNAPELLKMIAEEEEAKNVRVLCRLLQGGEAFQSPLPYAGREEEIVRACSRWFTLLDDFLDLRSDYEERQPNHLLARLVFFEEDSFFIGKVLSEDKDFHEACPRTFIWYREALGEARRRFISVFPVCSRFFACVIEGRARKKGQSPF
jgi:hypothetical protein